MAALCIPITALLSLLLLSAAQGCGINQYPETYRGRDVCCDYCPEGHYISEICTSSNSASKCEKCDADYYNPRNDRGHCKPCMHCLKGSIEISPCTKSSKAVCACPEGSTSKNDRNTSCVCEKGKEIIDNKCQPCQSGYFSTAENSVCQPWTNCNAKGETILEAGSATQDVQCTKAKNITVDIVPEAVTLALSSTGRISTVNQSSKKNLLNISNTEEPVTEKSMSWGLISLILGVILLSVSAGIILTMIIQTNKGRNRGFIKFERCKVPVQEESTSSDSSLGKQCPA